MFWVKLTKSSYTNPSQLTRRTMMVIRPSCGHPIKVSFNPW